MVRAQRRATAQALQLVVVALLSSGVFFKGGFAAPLSNDALEAEGEADAARAQNKGLVYIVSNRNRRTLHGTR